MKRFEITPLRAAVHLAGWLPGLWLIFDAYNGRLSVNPIQDITQRSGRYALYLLIASLACTPLYTLTGWREPIKQRRALGLYSFFYAVVHFTYFAVIDYGFDLVELGYQLQEKPFIFIGATSLVILTLLAATSFRPLMRRMGKRWQALHRGVYLASILVILHFSLARKGSLAGISGDIVLPLSLGIIVLLLLALRIPFIRKRASAIRRSF